MIIFNFIYVNEKLRNIPSEGGNRTSHELQQWPVLKKFCDRKFMIVNYASVWSLSYDRNLRHWLM